MEWYEIILFVIGFSTVLLWPPRKKKKKYKDHNIDYSGDDGAITEIRKNYPDIELKDDFRYKIEPKD